VSAVTPHLVCTNCGGGDTAAIIAAIFAGLTAIVTFALAIATFKMAGATRDVAAHAAD
jgi:hypothetical protein